MRACCQWSLNLGTRKITRILENSVYIFESKNVEYRIYSSYLIADVKLC